jgi:hypothetical protein
MCRPERIATVAAVNAKGGDGRTPLDLALKGERSTVVALLQSRGAVASTSP